MSSKAQYHCFYVWACGNERRYECFDNEAEMLALVRKANTDINYEFHWYRDLRVIYGNLLEFEPAKIVETWRVKESS